MTGSGTADEFKKYRRRKYCCLAKSTRKHLLEIDIPCQYQSCDETIFSLYYHEANLVCENRVPLLAGYHAIGREKVRCIIARQVKSLLWNLLDQKIDFCFTTIIQTDPKLEKRFGGKYIFLFIWKLNEQCHWFTVVFLRSFCGSLICSVLSLFN